MDMESSSAQDKNASTRKQGYGYNWRLKVLLGHLGFFMLFIQQAWQGDDSRGQDD